MISASPASILGTLKIVGIAVAGVAATVGVIKDTRTEDKKHLTVPGRIILVLGLLGASIALAAQFVEGAKAASDQAESNKRNTELLNEIKRAVTRIETIAMDVKLVVPTANRAFSPYLDDLSKWTNELVDENARAGEQYHGVQVITSTSEGPDVLRVGPLLLSALPTPSRHKQAAKYFSDLVPQILFYRTPIDIKLFDPRVVHPDLALAFKGGRMQFIYVPSKDPFGDPVHGRIGNISLEHLRMNAPSDDWTQTKNILSLQDITDGSQAILSQPDNTYDLKELWDQTTISSVTLYFNHQVFEIDMKKLIPATDRFGYRIYSYIFPSPSVK